MSTAQSAAEHDFASEASAIIRAATTASLATIDGPTGAPYASFITLACAADGAPIFLISELARHTKNLTANPKASILCVEPADGPVAGAASGAPADPLTRARVSLIGQAEKTDDPAIAQRFLRRHPEASGYADFADFGFYRLALSSAHLVAGFGRIHDLEVADLLTDLSGAQALLAAEADIVAHMNDDHADALELYATALLGAEAGAWRMSGCDPDGCDLVLGERGLRLTFPERAQSPGDVRNLLVTLVRDARAAQSR